MAELKKEEVEFPMCHLVAWTLMYGESTLFFILLYTLFSCMSRIVQSYRYNNFCYDYGYVALHWNIISITLQHIPYYDFDYVIK